MDEENPNDLSDGDLMQILGMPANNEEKANALEVLRQRYETEMLSVARGVLRDRILHGLEALDVVQELFAELLSTTKAERFNSECPLRPWLRRVVQNKARDLLRGENRYTHLPPEDLLPPDCHTSEQTTNRLFAEELLSRLTPQDRELCERFYLDRCSAQELAEEAGIEKTQLYRDLHRIRTQLREPPS